MKKALIIGVTLAITACGGSGDGTTGISSSSSSISSESSSSESSGSSVSSSSSESSSSSVSSSSESSISMPSTVGVLTSWIINDTNELSASIDAGSTLVNVQSVEAETVAGVDYAAVTASGIPNYVVPMTEGLVDWLNNRPKANSDFDGGATSAVAGNLYSFGADIGYKNAQCPDGEGQGYWPPGPACPADISRTGYFPVAAAPASTECDMGANTIGFAVNGVSIYGWFDGQSYNNAGVWSNLASIAEAYDVDICGGHAAGTNYHHHHYSDCWARVAGEDYDGHSEVYGYAADGYAVYGPYEDTEELAQSCWVKRDYSVGPTEEGYGCVGFNGAVAGERSCVLIDEYNPSLGVEAADSNGPTTSATVTSLSSNTFTTTSGFYKQDYYYDSACTTQSAAALDQHNGHSDEVRGYHYHLTIATESLGDDVPVTPVYPFTYGPRFAGEVSDNAVASCSAAGGAGPGGGPPGGLPRG